ncbi:MAG: hypothetical protein KAS32_16255, partial [Candidatus Peribacteraceae bacterium]|nr:hypothetical protein [Candidatus Peribacteraceae bacterium]
GGTGTPGLTQLRDNAGALVSGTSVKLSDDGIINSDKSASDIIALSVDEAQIDHGSVGGLTDDDHPALVPVDGSRAVDPTFTVESDTNANIIINSDKDNSADVVTSGILFQYAGTERASIYNHFKTYSTALLINYIHAGDVILAANSSVGIDEVAPETALEITKTAPYITLHNSTNEDSDGGRESRINFKGEQSSSSETTLARIEVSHDGAGADDKGKIVISVNDGNDVDTPSKTIEIDSNGTLITNQGKIDNTTRVTTTYTVLVSDHVIYADTDGGAFTLSLPAGVEGTNYKIINCGTSGNDLTVDPDGTEQLYGAGAGVASTLADGEVINIHYNVTEGWW